MKAPAFGYVRATSLADIFAQWAAAGPDAKLLAGGQSLLATLAFRLSEPTTLIDISRVPELAGITEAQGGAIRVGALTTHAQLGTHPLVRTQVPLLADAVPLIAHPAIRNRGTTVGSIASECCVAPGSSYGVAARSAMPRKSNARASCSGASRVRSAGVRSAR